MQDAELKVSGTWSPEVRRPCALAFWVQNPVTFYVSAFLYHIGLTCTGQATAPSCCLHHTCLGSWTHRTDPIDECLMHLARWETS